MMNVLSVQCKTPKDAEVSLIIGVSGSPQNLLAELSHVPLNTMLVSLL